MYVRLSVCLYVCLSVCLYVYFFMDIKNETNYLEQLQATAVPGTRRNRHDSLHQHRCPPRDNGDRVCEHISRSLGSVWSSEADASGTPCRSGASHATWTETAPADSGEGGAVGGATSDGLRLLSLLSSSSDMISSPGRNLRHESRTCHAGGSSFTWL